MPIAIVFVAAAAALVALVALTPRPGGGGGGAPRLGGLLGALGLDGGGEHTETRPIHRAVVGRQPTDTVVRTQSGRTVQAPPERPPGPQCAPGTKVLHYDQYNRPVCSEPLA